EDVAVMGFDDVPQASYTSPPLSSIHLPFEQITRQATEALLAIISDRPPPERQKVLPFKLVVRQSCGGLTQPVRLGGA
ncbi:MAG TPA: substrate-binding domain-containing protein, partial [Anaerolineaceae bacterium]|nr:substrate-binding domain-containing protein [Anaerolineaceae bacterium]